jgi:hypothetical protein
VAPYIWGIYIARKYGLFRDDVNLPEAGREGFRDEFIKQRAPSSPVHRSFDREDTDFRAELRGERDVFRIAESDQIDFQVNCLDVWQDCLASQATKYVKKLYTA